MPFLGIDIGGSGIKGAPVDLRRGTLTVDRFRVETPRPAVPDAVLDRVGQVVEHFAWAAPLGVTFPGVVRGGAACTAANLHRDWVGVDLAALLKERMDLDAVVLNDADAAGVAEVAYGAAKKVSGVVLMLTFGTGVGSALFVDGALVPNLELGHLPFRGTEAEKVVAESAREAKDLSWQRWAKLTNEYLALLEKLFSPDLVVIGGGIAKKPEKFKSLLKTRAPFKVAALGNQAGIVGAALAARQRFGRRRSASAR